MGDWALNGNAQVFESTTPTTVATASVANTKGSWVELTSATGIDASAVTLIVSNFSYYDDFLLDLGIGAAASEQVILSNLSLSYGNTIAAYFGVRQIKIPVPIPSGTRVAARAQQITADGDSVDCALFLESGTNAVGGEMVTIGAATADSGGTSVDPGAVALTKGSWVELSAATSEAIRGGFVCYGNQKNAVRTDAVWSVDIGIGAAASEQVLVPDLPLAATTGQDSLAPPNTLWTPFSIPAGTRVAARASCSITDATDRLFDIILYGLT